MRPLARRLPDVQAPLSNAEVGPVLLTPAQRRRRAIAAEFVVAAAAIGLFYWLGTGV